MASYSEIIVINPKIRFGRPTIKDTRITVYDVLGWLASGMSYSEITEDYPEITEREILACLAYAADKEHRLQVSG